VQRLRMNGTFSAHVKSTKPTKQQRRQEKVEAEKAEGDEEEEGIVVTMALSERVKSGEHARRCRPL
jgi:hypothetical protein